MKRVRKNAKKILRINKTYPKLYRGVQYGAAAVASMVLLWVLLPFIILGAFFFQQKIIIPITDYITQKPKVIKVGADGRVEINNDIIPKAEVTLKKWGDEGVMKIGLSNLGSAQKTDKNGVTKWDSGNESASFYKINDSSVSASDSWDTMRSLHLGSISPDEATSLTDYWHQNKPGPMIATYHMDRNAYIFWGYRNAATDLDNLSNLPAPIYRFKTAERKTCPVILATPNVMINYIYLPNLDKHPEYLETVQSSIIETLKKEYGLDVFKTESAFMYHDGTKIKQLGRIDQEGDYVGYYLYLDSPVGTDLVNNMNLVTKTRDTVLFPIGGLREINPHIDYSAADTINQNIAARFGAHLSGSGLTDLEKAGSNKFRAIQEDTKWTEAAKRIDDNFSKFDKGDQKFEFDVTWKKKPRTNQVNFNIDTKNLDFFYQPDLTPQERAEGKIRPENVIGSYAVYNKSKKGDYTAMGGKNYATGKAFQIYRPLVTDARGNKVWGDLHVDTGKGLLTVTVPQDFLDKAVYPVVVDPTFGYTVKGSSYDSLGALDRGSEFTFTNVYGAGTSMSYWLDDTKSSSSSYVTRGSLYRHSDSGLVLNGVTNTATLTGYTGDYLITATFPTSPDITPQDYVLMVSSGGYYYNGSTYYPSLRYDSGAASQGHTQPGTYAGTPPSTASFSHNNNKYSVYVTYTPDTTPPTNPTMIDRNPVGWSSVNSFDFTWSGATDSQSGIKGYEYKRDTDASWTFTTGNSVSGIQAYQNGTNIFEVRTIDNAGNTASGYTSINYYYSQAAPSAPQNLAVVPNTNTQNSFNFSWQLPASYNTGISGYRWSVNVTPSATNSVYTTATTTGAIPAATQQGLNTFYVVAIDTTGNVNYANFASIQFDAETTAPGVPTAPVISDISNRNTSPPKWALALSWNTPASGGTVDHYIVQRSTDQSNWVQAGTASTRVFVESGLDNTKLYYYRIIATDNAGAQSPASDVVSKQPMGKYPTPPDIRPPSVKVTATSATITWSTDRASSSFIQYGQTFAYGSSMGSPDSVVTHSVTLSGLSPGTTYHFRQQSYDEYRDYSADTAVSGDYTFTTQPPPGVTNVKISDIRLTSAVITWQSTTSTTTDLHYGKTNSYGQEYADPSGSAVTNHTVKLTNLNDSSTYHFKIFGTDTDGNSLSSDDYSFATLTMPKISNLKSDQVKGNIATLKITWDSNVPTSSTVDYSELPNGTTLENTQSDLVLQHEVIVAHLSDDTDYAITAIGRDAYGNEGENANIKVRTDPDTTPPEISEITTETSISGFGADAKAQMVVSWNTDEPSTSQIEYAKGVSGDSYGLSSKVDHSLVTSHVVVVSDLDPSSSYYFRAVSSDKAGNVANSSENSTLTAQAQSSIFDLILKSFSSTLGWLFGG